MAAFHECAPKCARIQAKDAGIKVNIEALFAAHLHELNRTVEIEPM
jgi:hypothetical protein